MKSDSKPMNSRTLPTLSATCLLEQRKLWVWFHPHITRIWPVNVVGVTCINFYKASLLARIHQSVVTKRPSCVKLERPGIMASVGISWRTQCFTSSVVFADGRLSFLASYFISVLLWASILSFIYRKLRVIHASKINVFSPNLGVLASWKMYLVSSLLNAQRNGFNHPRRFLNWYSTVWTKAWLNVNSCFSTRITVSKLSKYTNLPDAGHKFQWELYQFDCRSLSH